MIIDRIETFPLFHKLREPYGDANGWKAYRTCYLFRITTRSGLTGWGEAADWLPVLDRGFQERIIPFLTGKRADERTVLVETVGNWNKRAAAGVSLALTEIAAKGAGLSVSGLWGGARRSRLPVYASLQSYRPGEDWEKRSLEQVERVLQAGYRQLKIKIGGKPACEDRQHVRAVQSLSGGNVPLILDANQSYDAAAVKEWERHWACWDNLSWLEEPLPLDRAADYRLLRASLSIPVAGGENLAGPAKLLPLLQAEAFDISQPDPLHSGGIDAYREMLSLSRLYGKRVSPHTYDGSLSRLYALTAQACLEPWSKMENENIEPVEWDVMDNPFSRLFPLEPVDGFVSLPQGAGIGLEPDEEILRHYRWDGSIYS
ncbi:mandelate racemase/muconate lactonizing enzyme family protein [Paenibacillus aurantius]|uniref:Mandelate racemase/muconate lactonizing enzyme family protein n=1 Tax=Paenibacillus aurantius TaxID=2918900 RepID=A0AA96LBH4_9BACL|nr:mandelate racemase/muconate lactonizing enzyme family protein [Paenibacillus aurantius]WNQ10582.1 mandelate racemase/muconate lactonizing enzyme family protein [Paenibacillus aurantius]